MGVYGVTRIPHGPGGQTAPERVRTLRAMATSLLAMARELEGESSQAGTGPAEAALPRPGAELPDRAALLDRTAQDYANRRQRRRHFTAELFGEPAWDLLLDLFRARLEGKMITVTSACIAADVPLSTALRWLGVLEGEGLVERSRNVSDQRSTWVRLTDTGASAMIEYTQGCLARSRRAERLAGEGLLALLPDEAA